MIDKNLTYAVIYGGGKDGHLALLRTLAAGAKVSCLITIDGGPKHADLFHDLRKVEVLQLHSRLLGIPLFIYKAPPAFIPKSAELGKIVPVIIRAAARRYKFDALCSGSSDFDEDGSAAEFREAAGRAGLLLETPVAELDTFDSLRSAQRLGVRALIVGVEKAVSPAWLGRELGAGFTDHLKSLRAAGTPATGNDFQTLVLDSPAFSAPLKVLKTRVIKAPARTLLEVIAFRSGPAKKASPGRRR